MLKRLFVFIFSLLMLLACASCAQDVPDRVKENEREADEFESDVTDSTDVPLTQNNSGDLQGGTPSVSDDLKLGFIFLHDENSTYDLNFMKAVDEVQKKFGLRDEQIIYKTQVPEGNECYEVAAELAEAGCDMVFADSFGHEDFMIRAAREFPDVQFCHATGTKAHTEGLPNYHNAYADIHEGRYLAGVVAGMKLNQLIERNVIAPDQAKIGYVGAMPYAEVKSGMTAFYLGARSICPSATITVKYTESWYDYAKEKEFAGALIDDGCVLISQHADSMGSPTACENAGIPNVSYNGSTAAACPNTFLISSRINWAPYFEYVIGCLKDGKKIAADWSGGLSVGAVELSELGKNVADTTAQKLEEVKAKLIAGELEVFDTSTFTVAGKEVTTYLADVDTDPYFECDTEVIIDGAFKESFKRSAPYFDLNIDGVTTK